MPAIERFGELGLLESVDGLGRPDEVAARIVAAIDSPRLEMRTLRAPAPTVRSRSEVAKMRKAGQVVGRDARADRSRGGTWGHDVTLELDAVGRDVIERRGATSNFLGYHGFPAVICASPNNVIVHGIPDGYRLRDGDIISIDCGAIVDGWHGDAAFTMGVGTITPRRRG